MKSFLIAILLNGETFDTFLDEDEDFREKSDTQTQTKFPEDDVNKINFNIITIIKRIFKHSKTPSKSYTF